MKPILCVTATVLLLFTSLSHARGTPSSSFVPRGPEPHSSLNDKHHSKKAGHSSGRSSSHKAAQMNSKTASHSSEHKPGSN
jgi:hypothetical protein